MDRSRDQSEPDVFRQLTADQRLQIYEQEKSRIKQATPALSKKTKILIAVYFFGCVLVYFGIPGTLMDFCGTHQWSYKPETDIFQSLFNAAIELIRPFLAAAICGIPVAIVWLIGIGLWSWGSDLVQYLRKLTNRNDE